VFVVLICLGLVGAISSFSLKRFYQHRIANELETNALLVKNILKETTEVQAIQNSVLELSRQIEARITVVDSEGDVLGDSEEDPANMENHKNRPEIKIAFDNQIGQSIRFSNTIKIDMMYIAVPLVKKGEIWGVVRLALPLTEIKEKLSDIYKIVIVSLLMGGLISLALGALVGRSFSSPLSEMGSFAQKIVQGDFRHKIKVKSKDEIGQLAENLNAMSEQLEKKIEAIIEDKNRMQAILSSMREGVIVIDKNENIVLFNSSLATMLELRSKKYIGKPFWEIISNNEVNSILEKAIKKKNSFSVQVSILQLSETRNIQIQTAPITDNKGRLLGLVGVFHDVTELKKFEKARSEFIANVSHELKTPITSIIGFVETLRDGAINDLKKRDEFLNIIHSHSQRLNNLVNDILSLSRIEFREIEMNPVPISLKEILDNAKALYNDKIKSKKQSLRMHIPSELPPAFSDPEMIIQVFSNLIDNAVKFTPDRGKITVKAREKDDFIQIDVSDTGIGIEEEHLPRIFERFYRVDKARSREMGGTGLGLAIVKHIVHANKGKVSVKSESGKGSTFSVFLPKAAY
jgi:two-component system phosphate regulon sensor histidine kinase PhoR